MTTSRRIVNQPSAGKPVKEGFEQQVRQTFQLDSQIFGVCKILKQQYLVNEQLKYNILTSRRLFSDFQVDSDIDFRNGGERLARSRSRVEDISRRILVEENNPLNNRRSKSRQSNTDVNHLIHNSNFAHHITDTSDPENHIGQQYNNLSGRLGMYQLKLNK